MLAAVENQLEGTLTPTTPFSLQDVNVGAGVCGDVGR